MVLNPFSVEVFKSKYFYDCRAIVAANDADFSAILADWSCIFLNYYIPISANSSCSSAIWAKLDLASFISIAAIVLA